MSFRMRMTAAVLGVALTTSCDTPAGSGERGEAGKQHQVAEEAWQEAQRVAIARAKKFKAAVTTAKDPVGLAIPIAKDEVLYCARTGMEVLVKHWEDPRSERTLAEIAKGEPKYLSDGLKTVHGEAYERLLVVKARKIRRDLVRGKKSKKEKLAAVRDYFTKHPTLLNMQTRPSEKRFLVRELVSEAMESGGADTMDLVVKSGFRDIGSYMPYVKAHIKALIDHARRLGCEEALKSCNLLKVLVLSGNKEVVPLLEDWLAGAKGEAQIDSLVSALAELPGAKQRLLRLLGDARQAVVKNAAEWLCHSFPDRASLDAVRKALKRSKLAGATQKELDYLAAVVRDIEEKIADREKRKEKGDE